MHVYIYPATGTQPNIKHIFCWLCSNKKINTHNKSRNYKTQFTQHSWESQENQKTLYLTRTVVTKILLPGNSQQLANPSGTLGHKIEKCDFLKSVMWSDKIRFCYNVWFSQNIHYRWTQDNHHSTGKHISREVWNK